MKIFSKFFLLLTLLTILTLPTNVLAAVPQDSLLSGNPDQFVFGDNYILESGSTLNGNLWVFGGNAELRDGSRVNGDIMLFGGNLRVNGQIEGNINAAGGNVHLRNNAVVSGDVNTLGGNLSRDNNARVEGRVSDNRAVPFRFPAPGIVPVTPNININNPIVDFLGFLFQSILTAALAVLVALFIPIQTERVARTVVVQPVISGGLGLLTAIVVPIIMLILAITILLIPVSLILGLILGLALLFGWIAVGLEVGRRMARMFKAEWSLPLAAGLGTLALSIVIGGAGKYVWCIGWLLPTLVSLIGLGAVLLTRFGTQHYPPSGFAAGTVVSPAPTATPYTPVVPGQGSEEVNRASHDDLGSQWVNTPPSDEPYPPGGAEVYPPFDDEPPSRDQS
jgi:hypothetical protein